MIMAGTFDPYLEWLGIFPEDQPPDHYRLLGLERFEENGQLIQRHIDQRLRHLAKHKDGPHASACKEVVHRISLARACLLNPKLKPAYDQQLGENLSRCTENVLDNEQTSGSGGDDSLAATELTFADELPPRRTVAPARKAMRAAQTATKAMPAAKQAVAGAQASVPTNVTPGAENVRLEFRQQQSGRPE